MNYILPKGLMNPKPIIVDKSTGIMFVGKRVFTKKHMENLTYKYRNVNRIRKPIAMLFYTDVMNGQSSNYPNVIKTEQSGLN